ncbi:MAG TPA: 3D domain-containing protein [Chthoniobacteraceae bacterium]|jgi:3D (Asp-Asp-Asp) domain-containing protein|nr:3D domain-containing protein [Chthoniobacteraceae bacterium]
MNQPKLRNLSGLLVAVLALCSLAGCATQPKKQATVRSGKHMTVRTTAYTHTEKGGIKNAIGERLRFGGGGVYSAASDWSWIPLGTRFRIIGDPRTYVIEDYGSALVGRQTIDLYMPSRRSMNAWGVRHVEIEIVEWGSKAMSLKMLQPRTRNSHVRVMVAQLRKQGISPAG